MPELERPAAPDLAGRDRRRRDGAGDGRPRKAQGRARRRRDERLRRARREARRAGWGGPDAPPGALDPAAGDRQPLARAPLRHGLPARGDPPARLRPDRPAGRLQKRGLRDVRGADALDLGGIQQARLPRRDRSRAGQPEGVFAATAAAAEPTALDYSGGTSEGQPSALQQVAAGAGGAETAAKRPPPRRRSATAPPSWSRQWSRTSTTKSVATTRAGAAAGKSTRSATAPEGPVTRRSLLERPAGFPRPRTSKMLADGVLETGAPTTRSASSSAPSTSATSMPSSRSSTRRSSCTRCGGCARASRRRASGRRGRRAGCSRRSSSSSSTRTGPRAGAAPRWR